MPFAYDRREAYATFPAGMLGQKQPDGDREFTFCKNTDAAALSPGMMVKLETAATFYVDKASANTVIYGIVANELTGTTVAINYGFWALTKGQGYALWYGSKSVAIASFAILVPAGTAGYVEGHKGTYGAASFTTNKGLELSRLVAGNATKASTAAAGQVAVVLLR